MCPQTSPDRQRQCDIEALFPLIQRVIDDHHTTLLLLLTLVEAKDAAMLLRAGDVVGVRKDGGGNCSRGRSFRGMKGEERRGGEEGRVKNAPLLKHLNDLSYIIKT